MFDLGKTNKEPLTYTPLKQPLPSNISPGPRISLLSQLRSQKSQPVTLPEMQQNNNNTTWGKIKVGDLKGLSNSFLIGLGRFMAKTSTAEQNKGAANALANSNLPFISKEGQREQAKIQQGQDYLKAHPDNSLPAMIGETLPELPLWMVGQGVLGAAGKGLLKSSPKLLSLSEKVGSRIPGFVKGGLMDATTYGTVVAPTETIAQGDGLQGLAEREKQVPGVFLGGTALRGAGQAIGKGLGTLKSRGVQEAGATQTKVAPEGISVKLPQQIIQEEKIFWKNVSKELTSNGQVHPISVELLKKDIIDGKVDISKLSNAEEVRKMLKMDLQKFAEKTPEEQLPKLGTETPIPNERSFAQNVRGSQIATDEIKANLDKNKLTYEPITNKETFEKATQTVSENPTRAKDLFDAPSKGVSADDVALGEALITKAIKEGDTEGANRLIADLAEKLTTAGQAVQAASIFKRLSPEGMLLYAQRVVNGAKKDLLAKKGLNAPKVELTPVDSRFITDTMKRVQTLEDGREKDIAMAQVMQLIANKVPATKSKKLLGLQRISLLLNPKTMVRNTLGNTIFGTIDNLSNVVATPIDKLAGKFTGKRTATLPSLGTQLKAGVRGVKNTLEDAKLGVDTYGARTQYELPSGRTFDTNILHKLDQATKVGLQLGDRPFYNAAYDDVLRQQMKLAKVNEPTQAMIEQAHKIAQQRTYQDTNTFTNAFKLAQRALNGGKSIGLGNVVLPFVKTPANLLARAVDYSPIGITKAFTEARNIGKGKFDQRAFVDAISRSVTGTAIIMVGYDLAKKGIITGSGNKDKDVAAFERGLGKNDFAFKVGDNYYTYDWMQPASLGMAIGADVFLKGKDRKAAENVVVDAVKSGGETLFKQSVLQGLQRFMGGYSPIDNIAETIINAPTQLVPTFSKQIAQYTDPAQRSTTNPSNLGTVGNLIKSKIPGLSKSLEPKISTSGEAMQNYQGKNNLFNVFLNPGNATEFKPNKVQKEILRIYESTGDKTIFPKLAPKTFTEKGKTITLTPKEVTTFQQTMGKDTEKRMISIVNKSMSDKAEAKAMADAIEKAYEKAKSELLKSRK